MFTRLTSRRTALWLFGIAATFIGLCYILFISMPLEQGRAGIYILPEVNTLVKLFFVMWVVLFVSIIIYLVRTPNLSKFGPLALIALLLFLLPVLFTDAVPRTVFQIDLMSVSTPDHVYHLTQNMISNCEDGDLSSKRQCNYVFVYQCDSLGLVCTLNKGDVYVKHEQPISLRLVNNQIQVTSDGDQVIYSTPA